jgi:hypothetical protein
MVTPAVPKYRIAPSNPRSFNLSGSAPAGAAAFVTHLHRNRSRLSLNQSARHLAFISRPPCSRQRFSASAKK